MTTPNEKRIAIAEACGWRRKGPPGFADVNYKSWQNPAGKDAADCPDYLADLNAMHVAETALSPIQVLEYERQLAHCCFHATAAQRADAFLATISK